jgi:hypothetical protein
MNTCGGYGEEFEEGDNEYNAAQELGDVFPEIPGEPAADDLCPKCREKVRMTNVLFWFDS